MLATVAAGLSAAACDTSGLLDVQAPNSVPVDVYEDPAFATLMVNSVIGDFECAFGSFVVAEGLATDELHDSALNNGNWNMDRRDNAFTSGFYGVNSCTTVTGIYTPLSTARGEADAAINRLKEWTSAQVPNINTLTAQANLYAGAGVAKKVIGVERAAPLPTRKGAAEASHRAAA